MSDGLSSIDAILTVRLGLEPSAIGAGMIPRAVRARMKAVGVSDPEAYADLVRRSEVEVQALIDEVVVPESWFFRDDLPFRFLQEHARTGWAVRPARGPLRVLSMPCAGGEEPYSIAVTLEDAGLAADRCRIDAVDVSGLRLEHARRGLFSRNSLRGSNPDLVARWFQEHPQGFQIVEPVRRRVHFHQGNILDPRLLTDEPRYDVVFCRNLLIYLNPASRATALANLDRLLTDDGVLIIGHADAIDGSKFTALSNPGAFAYRRRKPGEAPTRRIEAESAPRPAEPEPLRLFSDLKTAYKAIEPLVRHEEAPAEPEPAPARLDEDSRTLLDQALEHADQGRHDRALSCCEQEIQRRGPSAAAFYLMGVVHQAAGRRTQAEGCFNKAVYLDPTHDGALLGLALSAERRGDRASAAGFRRRAERAMKNKGATHG